MKDDSTIAALTQPGTITDPLTEIARGGERRMLALALKSEVEESLSLHSGERLDDGRARVVRHGSGPERWIQTGIGPIAVCPPLRLCVGRRGLSPGPHGAGR